MFSYVYVYLSVTSCMYSHFYMYHLFVGLSCVYSCIYYHLFIYLNKNESNSNSACTVRCWCISSCTKNRKQENNYKRIQRNKTWRAALSQTTQCANPICWTRDAHPTQYKMRLPASSSSDLRFAWDAVWFPLSLSLAYKNLLHIIAHPWQNETKIMHTVWSILMFESPHPSNPWPIPHPLRP